MEEWSLPARRERVRLENGMELRLLSALEILQARREAEELAKGAEELPLCSNACLLARAMERPEAGAAFADGRAVLAALTAEDIGRLSARWGQLREQADPGLDLSHEELETLKKNSVTGRGNGCGGGC